MSSSINDPLIHENGSIYNGNNTSDHGDEVEKNRFTKHSAFVTLLLMSIGPLALIVQAVSETLDMLMITKRFKNEKDSHAIEILGFSNQFGSITGYIGLFFGQALTTRISTLLGSGDRENAAILVSNCYYLCIIIYCFFVAAFIFVIKPFLKFLGATDELSSSAFRYNAVSFFVAPLSTFGTLASYYFQSIGSSILNAMVKVIMYVLQLGIFSPLFLFVLKVPVTFMKMGNVVASTIVGILMTFLIYRGKFSLKPRFQDIIGPFTPELKYALMNAAPLILSFFVFVLPPILILRCMTSNDPDEKTEIAGVFAVFTQIATINQAFPGAFGQAFISAGTHAWGSNNAKRVVRLFSWTLLFNFVLTALVSVVVISAKSTIAHSFLHDTKENRTCFKDSSNSFLHSFFARN